jgi:predicted anti-sigma-YlaC factor YlaD
MGNAFSTGWRIARTRRSEFLDPARLRRRIVVTGTVAVVSGTVMVIADLLWGIFDGPWPLRLLAIICFAASLGCLVGVFLRVHSPGLDLRGTAAGTGTGDWRRDERIARQFAARPPAMLPEDRDEILARAERTLGPSVALAARFVLLPITWALVWAGALLSGLATGEQLTPLLLPPLLMLLQSTTFIVVVTSIGRSDAARRRALALEPAPVVEVPTRRNVDPRGSKIGLPGD